MEIASVRKKRLFCCALLYRILPPKARRHRRCASAKKQKPHTGAFGEAYELLPAPDDEGAAVAAEANVIFLGE